MFIYVNEFGDTPGGGLRGHDQLSGWCFEQKGGLLVAKCGTNRLQLQLLRGDTEDAVQSLSGPRTFEFADLPFACRTLADSKLCDDRSGGPGTEATIRLFDASGPAGESRSGDSDYLLALMFAASKPGQIYTPGIVGAKWLFQHQFELEGIQVHFVGVSFTSIGGYCFMNPADEQAPVPFFLWGADGASVTYYWLTRAQYTRFVESQPAAGEGGPIPCPAGTV